MVRVTGLEPAASCPPDKHATNCATPGNVLVLTKYNVIDTSIFNTDFQGDYASFSVSS